MNKPFILKSEYTPQGDQINAIESLTNGISTHMKEQTLLGVTGSGKTYTIANVINNVQKPTLVIAHNKTLAAQLYSEFKEFFPDNAVEYFVSYYDYYQPEAYIAHSDTYIEKDASINDEIDKLRHSATFALLERRDVIIVASVSCIYGLGDPKDYAQLVISLRPQMEVSRDDIIRKLVDIQYERNDIDFQRNRFRVRGDVIEVFPVYTDKKAIRIEFFGDEIDRITEIDPLTGKTLFELSHVAIYPASHYVTTPEKMERALEEIYKEMTDQVELFKSQNKLIEAQRIEQRTKYDMEMLREMGYCSGIENYSRIISNRKPGSPPYTLMDYFPDDFLLVINGSYVTLPQVRAMYNGDKARKTSLVDFGFRLPCAYDNRPLNFKEFNERINQAIYVSATPADYEKDRSCQIVEQIIRPTGLVDPEILVKPVEGQVDDILTMVNETTNKRQRVLITTLTKKMAEDLTDYLKEYDIKVQYLHSDVDTLERIEILRDLRMGEYDVLIGVNLLREGLDLPEVTLVCILDADKQGFLRSETSLIQTIGRAARNVDGKVIMYADEITDAMYKAISETQRRRNIQLEYNKKNKITPRSIKKDIRNIIEITRVAEDQSGYIIDKDEIKDKINMLTKEMLECAKNLDFERAAIVRDNIKELQRLIGG